MLVERFYPDEYLDSTYSIDFDELAAEGYKGVLFDIDNTLVAHGATAALWTASLASLPQAKGPWFLHRTAGTAFGSLK